MAGLRQGRLASATLATISFSPRFQQLKQQIDTASAQEKPDLNGCQTWLLFYRQNAHAGSQDAWRQRSTQHLNNCVSQHRDLSS